jgi:hypothetical protein
MKVFTVATLSASDVKDRNCRNWTQLVARQLEIGKTSRVRMMNFGYEGQGSPQWIADGHYIRMAGQRPDAALLSFFADGSVPLCPNLATNLANIYSAIDAIRAKRSDTPIFLIRSWRMTASREATTFAQLNGVYFTNYVTAAANRPNVSILDFYTPSGDPATHPGEWDGVDDIHPLLTWHQRVSIPLTVAALAPLVA